MSNSVEPTAVGELHEGADEEEPVLLLPVKASNDNGVAPDNGDEDEDNGEDTGEDVDNGEGDGAVSELRSSDVGGVNPPPVSEEDVDGVVALVGDIGGVDEANNAALVPFPLKSTVLMSLLFAVLLLLLLLLPPPIKSLAPFSKASTIWLKDDWVGEGGDVEEELDEVSREEGEEGDTGAVSKVIPSVLALSRNWLNSFLRASL